MKNGIKILNVEGAEILKRVNGENYTMSYSAVFSNSMLLDKLKEYKLKISKANTTRDIIAIKFSYGYKDLLNAEEVREKLYTEGFTLEFNKVNKKTGEVVSTETIDYVFFFRSASKSRVGNCFFINKKLYKKINKWQTMGIELQEDEDGKVKLVEIESYKSLTSSSTEGYVNINASKEILVVSDLDSYTDLQDIISIEKKDNKVIADRRKDKCKNTIWDGMSLADKCLFTNKYKDNSILVLRHHFFKTCAFNCNIQDYIKDYCKENNIDYYTYTITDRYNRKLLAKDIKLITTENSMKWEKFGVTMDYWCEKVAEDNNNFGVTKTDHFSKYGDMQRMSYQMINSLPLSKSSLDIMLNDTKEFVYKLKNDNDFFIEHLNRTANEVNINSLLVDLYEQNNSIVYSKMFKDIRKKAISSFVKDVKTGKVLVNANNLTVCANPFMLLEYAITDKLDKYINNNVIENYVDSTLEEKYSCYTNRFDDNEELAIFRNPHNAPNNIGYVINTKHKLINKYFNFNSNVIAVNLIKNDLQDRLNGMDEDSDFVFTTNNKEIVQASKEAQNYNTIINNIEQSKKTYNNSNKDLAELDNILAEAKSLIGETSNLAQILLSYMWDNKTKGLDYKEYEDEVCKLSVYAQIAIDNAKRQYNVDINKEMISIRASELLNYINSIEETYYTGKKHLKKTKTVITKTKYAKPSFWQYTNTESSTKEIEKKLSKFDWFKLLNEADKKKTIKDTQKEIIEGYADIKCPMNHLSKIVDNIEKAKKTKTIENVEFLVYYINSNKNRGARKQANKIEEIVSNFNNVCKSLNANISKEEIDEEYNIAFAECLEKVNKVKVDIYSMSLLIARVLDNNSKLKTDKHLKCKMLNMLYRKDKELFLQCFKSTEMLNEINS